MLFLVIYFCEKYFYCPKQKKNEKGALLCISPNTINVWLIQRQILVPVSMFSLLQFVVWFKDMKKIQSFPEHVVEKRLF